MAKSQEIQNIVKKNDKFNFIFWYRVYQITPLNLRTYFVEFHLIYIVVPNRIVGKKFLLKSAEKMGSRQVKTRLFFFIIIGYN